MDLDWFQSVIYSFLSGLTDILPVSAQAHKLLLLKFFGVKNSAPLMELFIHIGIFAALYFHSRVHIVRMSRARALSRIPKRKRKRPLDMKSLMDLSFLKTTLLPVVLGLFLYQYTQQWSKSLIFLSLFLFINGIILYAPQFFPTGNRDSRTLSRVEGLLMGLGSMTAILPGMSSIGAATSIASICGMDRTYSLSMALLMNLFLMLGFMVYDLLAIVGQGIGAVTAAALLRYLLASACAYGGTSLGIKAMRRLSESKGYALWGFYCFGLSLFTFILNLMA